MKTYEAIVKGENISRPSVPESFRVLMKELQSLGLDVKVMDEQDNEIEMTDVDDDDVVERKVDLQQNDAPETQKKLLINTQFTKQAKDTKLNFIDDSV